MKKIIGILIMGLMVFGLFGCGETNLDPNSLEEGKNFDYESLKDKKVKIDVATNVDDISEIKDGKVSIFLSYDMGTYKKTLRLEVNDKDGDGVTNSKDEKVEVGDKITIKSGVVTDVENHIITVDEIDIIPAK
jgi:hypothetical protein